MHDKITRIDKTTDRKHRSRQRWIPALTLITPSITSEFHVTDIEAAKRFYSDAFDWQFNDYGPEYAGIRHKNGDGEVGGFSLAEKVSGDGGPLVVLYSDDLEATYKAVKAVGGKITKEPFEFPWRQALSIPRS